MAELSLETVIKSGVEKALKKPIADGKSITEWAAIGMKAPRWVSANDRLPENQDPVIVFVPPHVDETKGTFLGYVGMAYHTSLGEGFWCGTDGNLYGAIGMIYPPTHWMPLPEPPKEVGGDE